MRKDAVGWEEKDRAIAPATPEPTFYSPPEPPLIPWPPAYYSLPFGCIDDMPTSWQFSSTPAPLSPVNDDGRMTTQPSHLTPASATVPYPFTPYPRTAANSVPTAFENASPDLQNDSWAGNAPPIDLSRGSYDEVIAVSVSVEDYLRGPGMGQETTIAHLPSTAFSASGRGDFSPLTARSGSPTVSFDPAYFNALYNSYAVIP